jgi:hypothetical protein
LIWIMPFWHPSEWPLPLQHQQFKEACYRAMSWVSEAGEVDPDVDHLALRDGLKWTGIFRRVWDAPP